MKIVYLSDFNVKTHVIKMAENTLVMRAIEGMVERHVSSVVVSEETKVIGIFTERDLLVKVVGKKKKVDDLKLSDVMTRGPKTCLLYTSRCV